MKTVESPLVVVIKMNAAERSLAFDEAEKYEDINKIYKDQSNDTTVPKDVWREMLIVQENMSKGKKYTNQFKYYDFDISEIIESNKAKVVMKSKLSSGIKTITYKLDLEEKGWKINAIEYQK